MAITEIDFLTRQTEEVYNWTNKLLESIPFEKWKTIPEVIESNITWQAGHLIMSHYFHSIMVIAGHQMDIIQTIPIKEYSGLFTITPPKNSEDGINPADLFNQLKIIQRKSLSIISTLTPEALESKLEPTPMAHPIAKTKLEAIDWNIKHTMYHCGQIGMIRRIIYERFDFGLRLAKQ